MKILPISDYRNTCGTSYYGATILASAKEIEEKLGIEITCYGGDKTNYEFDLELEDGTPFTIYDWKEDYILEDTAVYYHIGTKSMSDTQRVVNSLWEYGLDAKY